MAEQNLTFPRDPRDLIGDFWPPEESIEDFFRTPARIARPREDRPGCMTPVIVDTGLVSFLFKNPF